MTEWVLTRLANLWHDPLHQREYLKGNDSLLQLFDVKWGSRTLWSYNDTSSLNFPLKMCRAFSRSFCLVPMAKDDQRQAVRTLCVFAVPCPLAFRLFLIWCCNRKNGDKSFYHVSMKHVDHFQHFYSTPLSTKSTWRSQVFGRFFWASLRFSIGLGAVANWDLWFLQSWPFDCTRGTQFQVSSFDFWILSHFIHDVSCWCAYQKPAAWAWALSHPGSFFFSCRLCNWNLAHGKAWVVPEGLPECFGDGYVTNFTHRLCQPQGLNAPKS